jgi:hypothetical protein
MAPVVIVLVGGFLAASFQWLPAFELAEHFSYMLNNPSGRSAFLTSPSGFYEMPQSLAEYYPHPNEDERQFISRLYLTGGILTIPILLLLLLRLKDRISLAAFLSAATFLFLSFSPIDVWRFLPKFTWAVQFPYRLLSVTALFVALGICLTIKRMKHWEFALLITLLLIQSWNLLLMPPYSSRLPVPQRDIPDAFASLDYLILPKPLFASNDRWVISHNLPIVADKFPWRENIVDSRSHLIKDNFLRLPSQVKQRYVRIIGAVEDEQTSKSLWIAGSSNPDVPIDGLRAVGPGEFDVVFRIPAELIDVTIQSDAASRPAVPMEGKFAETKNIRLKTVDFLAGNRIEVPADGPKFLWLLGSSVFTEAIDVWLADPARPAIPVSDPISIGPGAFEIWLKLPEQPGEYTLVSSRYLVPAIADSRSSDFRRLSIAVSARMLVADATTPIRVISADLVERQSSHGYTRNFHVLPAARRAGYDNTGGHVELPIAYNPLFTVSQRGSILRGQPTDTGHLLVATKDLDSPFVVQFRLPWIIWPTTALGFIFIFIGILAGRRS